MFVFYTQHLYFSVKACADAYVALPSDPFDISQNVYEIAFGINGNSRAEIRNRIQGEAKAWFDEEDMLSCDEFR